MSIMKKIAHMGKPGMFGAVCAAIAITAAATYTAKLSLELNTALEEIDEARTVLGGLETQAASTVNEINGLERYRDDLLNNMREMMASDIAKGKFDDAVSVRATELGYRILEVSASPDVDVQR